MDRKTYRSNKFGSWEYSNLDAQTIQATASDGIEFRYDLMQVTPNTLKASSDVVSRSKIKQLRWLNGF